MVRKIVQSRALARQRQTVNQKVVVRIDAIPKPRTKRAGKRAIGGKDTLLQMMMMAMNRPPAQISMNPAYNIIGGDSVSSQLNQLTDKLNELRDENAMIRSRLEPELVRGRDLHVRAPEEETFLRASEKINENVGAMKELISEKDRLAGMARENMRDWMQDEADKRADQLGQERKPVVVIGPPKAEELEEAKMKLKPVTPPPPPPPPPPAPVGAEVGLEQVLEQEPEIEDVEVDEGPIELKPDVGDVEVEPEIEDVEVEEEPVGRAQKGLSQYDREFILKNWQTMDAKLIKKYAKKLGLKAGSLRSQEEKKRMRQNIYNFVKP